MGNMTYNDVCKIAATLQHCNLANPDKMEVKSHREGQGVFFSFSFERWLRKAAEYKTFDNKTKILILNFSEEQGSPF